MTLIVGWAALDQKAKRNEVSAIYLMSDSRISWEDGKFWDKARKLFHFQKHPSVLGFSGDVLFPTQALPQIITLGDNGLIFNANSTFKQRSAAIFTSLRKLFEDYPRVKVRGEFSIYHCGQCEDKTFSCSILNWKQLQGWTQQEISLPEQTGLLVHDGSCGSFFNGHFTANFKKNTQITSRDIFQSFVETLEKNKNPTCGGAPQLAGVYRNGKANTFGLLLNGNRIAIGLNVDDEFGQIEWRNELFERCDPKTKQIIPGAQRQPKVR